MAARELESPGIPALDEAGRYFGFFVFSALIFAQRSFAFRESFALRAADMVRFAGAALRLR